MNLWIVLQRLNIVKISGINLELIFIIKHEKTQFI